VAFAQPTSVTSRCCRTCETGYFADIVSRFDPAAQKQISADQIRFPWLGRTALLGPLTGWKLVQSHFSGGMESRIYDVTFAYGSLPVTIDMNHSGMPQGLWFGMARNTAPVTTPAYASPQAFKAEKVTVGSAPNLCDGILTTPTAIHPPFPAAVLIPGSGPLDKDETIGPNHPFADLAEGLSTLGIVVLRYDKRTHSHPKMNPASFSVEQEYLEDGISAVALLRSLPDVDANRIFVIGHSEGATLAPEIAQRGAPVAGVVMLAPGGVPFSTN
jgi:Alpha/beta hydrolase family